MPKKATEIDTLGEVRRLCVLIETGWWKQYNWSTPERTRITHSCLYNTRTINDPPNPLFCIKTDEKGYIMVLLNNTWYLYKIIHPHLEEKDDDVMLKDLIKREEKLIEDIENKLKLNNPSAIA